MMLQLLDDLEWFLEEAQERIEARNGMILDAVAALETFVAESSPDRDREKDIAHCQDIIARARALVLTDTTSIETVSAGAGA